MSPGRQESTETEVTTGQAIKTLAQLLARQAAREFLVVPSSSTAAADASAIPNSTLNEEETRHE